MNRDFYIVQRCWHSGHQQQPPLDYLRLFTTQRDAEEAAYHSAHAWSHFGSSGREGSVRTVQLPLHPSDDPERTCYGFTANGTLFWVRGVIAIVDDEASQGSAIVTNGVIGWTGDENARRGSEISVGRVRWSMVGPGLVINESRLTPDAKELGRWLEAMMSLLWRMQLQQVEKSRQGVCKASSLS